MKRIITFILALFICFLITGCTNKTKRVYEDEILLGRYPQTRVTDLAVINALNEINETNELGFIEYLNNSYYKEEDAYFLVEQIKWKKLEVDENIYYVTEMILDVEVFQSDKYFTVDSYAYLKKPGVPDNIYANNYYYSIIREWLNNDFLVFAFTSGEKKQIKQVEIDNSSATTMSESNKYACQNTLDYVFCLSHTEAQDPSFMKAKPTDYAIFKGIDVYTDGKTNPECVGNSIYWLRSPNDYYGYNVSGVNYNGLVYDYVNCYYNHVGVRPAIVLA